MSSHKGFYTWADGALMKCLSAQHCLFIPGSLEGDLASLFSLAWQCFSHIFPSTAVSQISLPQPPPGWQSGTGTQS